MLFEHAASELPLLVFSLLVPVSILAIGLIALVRPASLEEAESRRLDKLLSIPAVIMLVGLAGAVMHVGYPANIMGMMNGVGRSVLSNEIVVAGGAIGVTAVYWILCLLRRPLLPHKAWGGLIAILAIVCTVFIGLAYMVSTILTWNTPLSWVGHLFNVLLGGGALAAATLALAKVESGRIGERVLIVCSLVGLVGALVSVMVQASVAASAVASTGATLAGAMSSYYACAGAAAVFGIAGLALWARGIKAESGKAFVIAACLLVFVALVLLRIDFYGIYLTVGFAV